jgi:predicted dehydrogenase
MKACIVGYGNMGHNHARAARALGVEVVTVDTDPAAGADFTEWQRADVCCIATPPDQLTTAAANALALGMRALIEKPGALHAAELARLHDSGRFFVGYTERFNPAVEALAHHLSLAGEIHHVSIRRLGLPWSGPKHPVLDLATHDFDVLDYLGLNPQAERISGTESHAVATLKLSEGIATVEASHLYSRKVRTLEVAGSKGVLSLDYQAQTLDFNDGAHRSIHVDKGDALQREWRAFLAGERSDGLTALRLAESLVAEAVAA